MSRRRNALVVVPTGIAVVLLTAAFTGDPPPPRPEPAASLGPGSVQADAFGPATLVRETLFTPPMPSLGRVVTEADLASLLDREPVRKAKVAYDAGRFGETLALLTESEAKTPAERFLRALALLKAGKVAEAAPAFLALSTDYPALADRCRFLAGSAFERAGDLGSAAGAYDAVEEESLLFTEAQFALADVLRRSGDLKAAAAVWKPLAERPAPLWGWDIGGDALWELASAQQAAGLRKPAGASFLKLWSEHAAARHADQALERADDLEATPTPQQVILHAEGLMEAHHNQQAASAVSPIVEAPPKGLPAAALCRARYVLGKSYRKMHWHAKAVAVLDLGASECRSEPELRAKMLYVAGTAATFVNPETAIRLYRTLAQELPDSSLADDALFDEADLLARAGRTAQARIALQRLIKLYPDGDSRPEALFNLFWLERTEGRPERGLKALERLAREYGASDPVSAERAMYWRGRTLMGLGRKDAALSAWEQLALTHPASFYALLARSRIGEAQPDRALALAARLVVPASLSAELKMPAGVLENDRHLAAALELLRLGLPEMARDELLGIDRGRLRAGDSTDAVRLLVTLLSRAGEVRLAHAIARNELRADLSGTVDAETVQVWRVAFPLAFRDEIEEHAQEAGVDPDLIQALIREESALDPKVHSWAGAIGLCQLMMPTAREVAGWLKLKDPITVERLHDPDLNVQLGATYLSRLIKQFKGNIALSLASYNAGAGAVSGWIQRSGLAELDEFVEQIPVSETRNYVKRVLKTYAAYQYLYGRGARGATIAQTLVASK